jgi:AraC-like DNA-binding protein
MTSVPPLPSSPDARRRNRQPVLSCRPGPAVAVWLGRARVGAGGVGRLHHGCLLFSSDDGRSRTHAGRRDVDLEGGGHRWPRTTSGPGRPDRRRRGRSPSLDARDSQRRPPGQETLGAFRRAGGNPATLLYARRPYSGAVSGIFPQPDGYLSSEDNGFAGHDVQPLIRAATLDGYLELAGQLGLAGPSLVAQVGLDVGDLRAPDAWLPAEAAVRLLDISATLSAQPDFALLLGERRRLATLGPISVAVREEPDLRHVLRVLVLHVVSYNEALRMRLDEGDGAATIRVWLELDAPAPVRQATVLAVAAVNGVIRECVDESWRPLGASFAFPAPADPGRYRAAFGPGLRFEQPFTGLVLRSRDLTSSNRLSDPLLRPYAQQFLEAAVTRRGSSTTARVAELIELMLPAGRCSLTAVAKTLQLDPRTLRRHLAGEGTSFSALVDDSRAALAKRHLGSGTRSMTEISQLLGFQTPSAFSRWFVVHFGMTARDWRKGSRT